MLSVDEEFVHTVRTWKGKIYEMMMKKLISLTTIQLVSNVHLPYFCLFLIKINALHLTALIMTGCQTCF